MKKFLSLTLALLTLASAAVIAIPASAESPFSDVKETRWSYSSVIYAVERGYMKGVADGKFFPAGTLTRAMVATVLWRRQDEPAPTAPSGFSDVKDGTWYSDAVAWAKEAGVVMGVSDTKFKPNDNVTREQLAAMLYRYAAVLFGALSGFADTAGFPDAGKISPWARDAVRWAIGADLIRGGSDGKLNPGGFATREQFAAIVERFDAFSEAQVPLVDADFYVSIRGDDGGDGSFARPFRTLARAVSAVRELDKTGLEGVTVAIRAGEYVAFDFDLTPADSGTESCGIRYVAYGDGPVTVTDGSDIALAEFRTLNDGEKTPFKGSAADSIKLADLDGRIPDGTDVRDYEVTVGNEKLWPARYPNKSAEGLDSIIEKAARVTASDKIAIDAPVLPRRLAKAASLDGAILYGNIEYGSIYNSLAIGGYDEAAKTVTFADPTEMLSYPWAGGLFVVRDDGGEIDYEYTRCEINLILMNVKEELDDAGEYYAGDGAFYVYAPEGDLHVRSSGRDNGRAEFVSFEGIDFVKDGFRREYAMPVRYIDHAAGEPFRILNISDPQLNTSEWYEPQGELLERIIRELVETERPDLITVTGDLAWGGEFGSLRNLGDLLEEIGIPWAPIFGNHDHQDMDVYVDMNAKILKSYENCLFEVGDPELGCGNYVIILREGGEPVHALIMMDTHGKEGHVDEDGGDYSVYDDFSPGQIEWYGKVCDRLSAEGVPESTLFHHIPIYTYNEALAAAIKPGIDPATVDPSEGAQVGCWAEGYEDSFGTALSSISSNPRDNGFFDVVLAHGNTKTLICGHNHENSFSIGYRGVRFVYSLKTGSGCSWDPRSSGGTVIDIDDAGRATVRHHYVK